MVTKSKTSVRENTINEIALIISRSSLCSECKNIILKKLGELKK